MNSKDLIRQKILQIGEDQRKFKSSDILLQLEGQVTRQYISTILQDMVGEGELIRQGGGRYTVYALPKYSNLLTNTVRRHLRNEDLKEDLVLADIERRASFIRRLKPNVYSVFRYAFLEMLNNAIEHSRSKTIDIEIFKSGNNLIFIVEDYGIGVYKNVMKQRRLASELEAMQDILKGKTTTLPENHSGEGIFFTSKVSDVFILDSYGLRLRVDNLINDIFYEELAKKVSGTKVTFIIDLDSEKSSEGIFVEYQTDPAQGGFDKTEIRVKLYAGGSIYVSRSQARRIMEGLGEKFKTIILDYDKVPTVGQAFADEIYRVFQSRHPETTIKSINMNSAIEFMVNRVERPDNTQLPV